MLCLPPLLHQPWLGRKEAGGGVGRTLQRGGRNSAGNHSNEAMKPKPCLRTNWPDLAWSRGANAVEEAGPWLRPGGVEQKEPQCVALGAGALAEMSKRDSHHCFLPVSCLLGREGGSRVPQPPLWPGLEGGPGLPLIPSTTAVTLHISFLALFLHSAPRSSPILPSIQAFKFTFEVQTLKE